MNKTWVGLTLAVAALGVAWQLSSLRDIPSSAMTPPEPEWQVSAQTLPDIPWDNLVGEQQRLTDWQGDILVVNNWATWCEPCRREIPMFMDFQVRYAEQGVVLIGLAHDDLEDVRRYVGEMGMDYPQLIADAERGAKWLKILGNNGSLPLTLIYDREGQLRAKKLGLMSERELEKVVTNLL